VRRCIERRALRHERPREAIGELAAISERLVGEALEPRLLRKFPRIREDLLTIEDALSREAAIDLGAQLGEALKGERWRSRQRHPFWRSIGRLDHAGTAPSKLRKPAREVEQLNLVHSCSREHPHLQSEFGGFVSNSRSNAPLIDARESGKPVKSA
jgi:hypothetical protein